MSFIPNNTTPLGAFYNYFYACLKFVNNIRKDEIKGPFSTENICSVIMDTIANVFHNPDFENEQYNIFSAELFMKAVFDKLRNVAGSEWIHKIINKQPSEITNDELVVRDDMKFNEDLMALFVGINCIQIFGLSLLDISIGNMIVDLSAGERVSSLVTVLDIVASETKNGIVLLKNIMKHFKFNDVPLININRIYREYDRIEAENKCKPIVLFLFEMMLVGVTVLHIEDDSNFVDRDCDEKCMFNMFSGNYEVAKHLFNVCRITDEEAKANNIPLLPETAKKIEEIRNKCKAEDKEDVESVEKPADDTSGESDA